MIADKTTMNELYGYIEDVIDSEDVIRKLYRNDISSFITIDKKVKGSSIFSNVSLEVLEQSIRVIIWHIISKKIPHYEYEYLLKVYSKEVIKN